MRDVHKCGTLVVSNLKYKKPPVVETVIGVQFPDLEGFHAVHFGMYWETVRKRFPNVSDQPRLEPVRERFPRPLPLPGPPFQLVRPTPPDRVWYTAASGSELIQVQPDRFLFNWRQREEDDTYPSYKKNSERFFDEFERFRRFCEQHDLATPTPEICEVTYVNHIQPKPGEKAIELAGHLFSGLRWDTTQGFLSTPESLTFNRAFVIEHQEKPIGRLYAEASIAVQRQNGGPSEFVLLNLTARVNHDSGGERELTESMQQAHDWVVRGFADLTDKQIQDDRWEKQE